MKKFLQKKLKEQKGMTLIELLAVIVIIAIIAAIAIPAIGTIIENSRNGAVKSDYQNALASANIYFTENPSAPSVTVNVLAGKAAGASGTTTSYLDDQGSLANEVIITKVTGGNTIAGSATANNKTYTITNPRTNSQLSAIKNADFTGTTIGGTAPVQ
ncbi:prepilin-type N-terminal cleavage/methylation domain-containing protein [Planococcus glaciei]|uniref:Prepilin-type N-terminal cleavage/methylation domain-containing protein n=1 Tax=Planococcus glaciei TaxID=459472 RepID=A0A7H8QCH8_9BACL|nr:prepilin-type N-terminal cleavage/methylation domain-containing protein [Planococcus glaciei]QDY46250.1 prepilin-type N-terminal cleavage/methylation domain-containing protein [Planococcus glaciei]QKX51724.1 prepilin-type N-terminal cleavage/methylation domain-containing protein [Planococcus glaciei]